MCVSIRRSRSYGMKCRIAIINEIIESCLVGGGEIEMLFCYGFNSFALTSVDDDQEEAGQMFYFDD